MAGYYVIPFKLLSVRLSVHLSISASFPCSYVSIFRPIFFKFCIGIDIGKEWYGIANGLISFRNNLVMVLDLCKNVFFPDIFRIDG